MFVRQSQFRNASADVQLFYTSSTWNKPPGASQIYMLLIGGGADGSGGTAGASGVVTTWWGSAKNVPDSLVVNVSTGESSNSTVNYRAANGLNALLTAAGAVTGGGAPAAMTANAFANSGIFNSVAGSTSGTTASVSTFLQAGTVSGAGTPVANYGYTTDSSSATPMGFFQLSPVIVGCGSSGNRKSGIGCGSAGLVGGGGAGLVIIASW